jgi:hypothetical protein
MFKMDQNLIVKQEDRNFINKAKKFMSDKKQTLEKLRTDYKEKIVDTGKSKEIEQKIEDDAKRTKRAIKIAGTIATVALAFCPADGPFGEICAALATPGLCALVDVAADIKKKTLITGKRSIEKHLLKVDDSNGDIKGYNLENGEIVEDFKNLLSIANDLSSKRCI